MNGSSYKMNSSSYKMNGDIGAKKYDNFPLLSKNFVLSRILKSYVLIDTLYS
jgi:hypothetical protein